MGNLTSSLSDLLVECVLQRAPALLIGDPEVLAHVERHSDASGLVTTPAGNALVLRQREASAFVWVSGSPDGPVREVTAAVHLDALDREPELLGHIDCPSGRLVIGTAEAVAAWGSEIEPDDGLLAQARAYRPDRRHCGHVVIVRVEPGRRQVLAIAGDDGLEALVVQCRDLSAVSMELLIAS